MVSTCKACMLILLKKDGVLFLSFCDAANSNNALIWNKKNNKEMLIVLLCMLTGRSLMLAKNLCDR